MKSLFHAPVSAEVIERIQKIHADLKPLWGKMNSAQMLAHCTIATEYACGDHPARQIFLGRIFGTPFKANFYNEKPFGRNLPTSPKFIVADSRDVEAEKKKLISTLERFATNGPQGVTRYPHQWYGPLTPEQWGIGMYKHLHHHLQQFGV